MVINDEFRKIKINDSILDRIYYFCQIQKGKPESGGILAGRENISNNNLIIEYHTEPMLSDFQSRYKFIRKDAGHLSFFQNIYVNSNGTIGYIGEWHTHPENVPHYSKIDLKNWQKINTEIKNNNGQYHLIAGIKAITIWRYNIQNNLPIKIATIYWDNINL